MLLLDLVYLLALLALSPWLVWRAAVTGRYRRELGAKLFGRVAAPIPQRKPVAWFHAVSVGEVNLLGTLVPAFRKRHPEYLVVVSSTTDTGIAEARRRFADLAVIAFPFDFSWAVGAALDAVRPALVVLTESEMWPNFLSAAKQRGVPVVVVNARMSPRSFARLRRFRGLARRMLFGKVARFAVQEQEYADRFRQLGLLAEKVVITGSIKYDGASARAGEKSRALAVLLGLPQRVDTGTRGHGDTGTESRTVISPRVSVSPCPRASERPLVLLAGSTHAPEEAVVLAAFGRLRERFPHLKLILVPRHPDRFAEVARLVEQTGLPFVRRSAVREPLAEMPAVVLLDTVGELGAAWGLADVGFTGGSLDGVRGGQSMIEPAGYGVPCVFGPHVWNFRDAARRLVEVGAAVMVTDAAALETELARLIADPALRERMGETARELVRRQQGATDRTLAQLDTLLPLTSLSRAA
ncbi:3-deoxy-D-manno-octulosonic-acid transferase OS=Planctomyces maris DSM 8797 GN=PM8797T_01709 PE=4 SV=1: Glycos_transf_N [Gemmataceae bacterium]|nr:3-deoxy-D-manno-octulosonic-acid transferase OS=Planctomyces maris DSM 8797 GN=PM8797T_01709 PE=4 SV=1: Glycos_transf_N [Gemmataceae bacterium]VTU02161.1 3-deoxy-D-manno-octulosonic-acid transferase OS=Planctomyces maris DSM 8797 GN=PM8797T_01709 PE=4 SV=1: Glycos_transf_N [Gemmataceae bacterium]